MKNKSSQNSDIGDDRMVIVSSIRSRYDVICPRCNSTFWDTEIAFMNPCGNESTLRTCRECADELIERLPDWNIRIIRTF